MVWGPERERAQEEWGEEDGGIGKEGEVNASIPEATRDDSRSGTAQTAHITVCIHPTHLTPPALRTLIPHHTTPHTTTGKRRYYALPSLILFEFHRVVDTSTAPMTLSNLRQDGS